MEGMEYFNFNANVTILFETWKVKTVPGLLGSCVSVLFLAFVYELLKTLRHLHLRNTATNIRHREVETVTEKTSILEKQAEGEVSILSWPHGLQTLLHVLQVLVGYILMLIVMTYNVWLLLSVLIGAGLGYFAFAWKRKISVDVQETHRK